MIACTSEHIIYIDDYHMVLCTHTTTEHVHIQARIIEVSGGHHHIMALDSGGRLWGLGLNSSCQLGVDTDISYVIAPVLIDLPRCIHLVECGHNHTIALDTMNMIWATGANNHGQLGLGHTKYVEGFTLIKYLFDVIDVGCRYHSTILLDKHNHVYGCGLNIDGQLGLGHYNAVSTFTRIDTSMIQARVSEIICGPSHTILRDQNNQFWGCGKDGRICSYTFSLLSFPRDTYAISSGNKITLWADSDGIHKSGSHTSLNRNIHIHHPDCTIETTSRDSVCATLDADGNLCIYTIT